MMTALKHKLGRIVRPLRRSWQERNDLRRLNGLHTIVPTVENLRSVSDQAVRAYLDSSQFAKEWLDSQKRLEQVNPPDYADGVNRGDQRALYHLVRSLKPARILEVGTHIGSSTLAMALAAEQNSKEGTQSLITTVDIRDVNDPISKPWQQFGSNASPISKLEGLLLHDYVEFKVSDSLSFLTDCPDTFDLVFLDGNYSANVLYRELPLALERLNKAGTILLHDYFPQGEPLWPNTRAILGPWQAVSRFTEEKAGIEVLPLAGLP